MRKKLNRVLAFALVLIMCLSMLPMGVLAATCEHHPDHTPECGYAPAEAGQACNHVCGDACTKTITSCNHTHTAECYPDGDTTAEPSLCSHVCGEGCTTQVKECVHTHNADCGYKEAVAEKACNFVCDVCSKTPETPDPVAVTGVAVSSGSASLSVGGTVQLSATVSPADATNKTVQWTSGNPAVATVSADGLVTAVSEGTATITVTTQDGGFTTSAAVTVTEATVAVTSVTVNPTSALLQVRDTLQLTATVAPANAANKAVSWTTSDETIATVDANGLVTAVALGDVTITATTADGGHTATCAVTVEYAPVESVTVTPGYATLDVGELLALIINVFPEGANGGVTFASSDESVATVDVCGNVIAVGVGYAEITVTTDDGGFTDTCVVSVIKDVHELKLNKSKLTLVEGKAETLVATVLPVDASNKAVYWTSSDESIATVDDSGNVTAVSRGTAVITAIAPGGEEPVNRAAGAPKTAQCTVTVLPAKCTVTFDSNCDTVIAPVTVDNGKPVSAPKTPVNGDYVFLGWYTDETWTQKWDFSKGVTDHMTLHALWGHSFNMVYKTGSSTVYMEETVNTNLDQYTFTVTHLKPHKSGYSFIGWNSSRDGKGTKYKAGDKIILSVDHPTKTLFAQWKKMDSTNPKTSDDSNIRLWTGVLAVSGLALIGTCVYILITKNKKKK